MSRAEQQAAAEFVADNMLFALLHEMGHGLIADLQLPVLGREEDAADAFATVTLIKLGTDFSRRVLANATKGWFLSDRRSRKRGEEMVYFDEHGLDLPRAYNIVCMMVGSDPDRFKEVADQANLPEERRYTCLGDYSNASWSWDKLLKPYLRSGRTPIKYDVTYAQATDDYAAYERAFQAADLIERAGEYAADQYAWNTPFSMEWRSCGEVGARWNVPAHKVTLCYELAQDFMQLFTGQELQPVALNSTQGGQLPLGTTQKGLR
jgi:Putative metallopeptidase